MGEYFVFQEICIYFAAQSTFNYYYQKYGKPIR